MNIIGPNPPTEECPRELTTKQGVKEVLELNISKPS